MEKTNYSLVKISAGLIFTMFMMLCVLSCDKIDNPIRYGGGSKILLYNKPLRQLSM